MEVYQIEQQRVEQNSVWRDIRDFVEGEALSLPLHEAEEGLFRWLLALGREFLKEVLARHGTGRTEGEVVLSTGERLPYHMLKDRKYLSIFGLVEIVRAYYWKEGASQGAYPLDRKLNLPERRYSYLLDKWTQSGVAEETYDEATGGISDLLGLTVWKRGQEAVARDATQDVNVFYREKPAPDASTEGPVLCATADCKGVPMVPSERPEPPQPGPVGKVRRGKGEKKKGLRRDAVVTADYSFVPEMRTPEFMIDVLMRTLSEQKRESLKAKQRDRRAHGVAEPRAPLNKQVRATMEGKEAAFRNLADRMAGRDPTACKPIHVLIDGDPALEAGLLDEFARRGWSGRITGVCLDIMHAMEYLWEAGTALLGEKNPTRTDWVRERGLSLLRGHVGYVIGGLRNSLNRPRGSPLRAHQQKALNKAISYYENHQHMMCYDRFLRAGYAIATGVIEGACGSIVKDRTDGSGMTWCRVGAQAVLDLRVLKRNGDWGDYWAYHMHHERSRLYEFSVN